MWRSLLLGKLAVSIAASLAASVYCLWLARGANITFTQSAQWAGIGLFFGFVGLLQMTAVFFLSKRKKRLSNR